MGELLKRFYELWASSADLPAVGAAPIENPVYFVGDPRVAQAMSELGMILEGPGMGSRPGSRIEFWSPGRGSLSGAWIERLPEGGEATQRVFAAAFQGLRPGAPLLVLHRQEENRGLMAWLSQAGFSVKLEGRGPGGMQSAKPTQGVLLASRLLSGPS
ncbi:MAG: hypothetical protein ACK5QT_04025 [Oligoflexia bacterium]|jgi:hypothetical protein